MYTTIFLLLLTTSCGWSVGDWRPVGQGDPLIDPTHVYSPPHVQHVHYWLRAPSLSLEPPPSRVSELSQVAGWPQISSHYHLTSTTPIPISFTTLHTTQELPTTDNPTTQFFSTIGYSPSSIPMETPGTTATTAFTTSTAPTTSTSAATTTMHIPSPLTFVIQGHSKVKKYGPLPESFNSIHNVNHNHLTSTKV